MAGMITTDSPLRHPLQTIVSLGQLYGVVLYYATSTFDHTMYGVSYSRPEAFYFYGYYILMNFFWMVIPIVLIYNSTTAGAEAFKIAKAASVAKKGM